MNKRKGNKTPLVKKISNRTIRVSKKTAPQPETAIVALAKKGKLAKAGQKALRSSLKSGLSVIILDNDVIFRLSPDGSRTELKKVPSSSKKYRTGKYRLA